VTKVLNHARAGPHLNKAEALIDWRAAALPKLGVGTCLPFARLGFQYDLPGALGDLVGSGTPSKGK
jgi:hypothetical protein